MSIDHCSASADINGAFESRLGAENVRLHAELQAVRDIVTDDQDAPLTAVVRKIVDELQAERKDSERFRVMLLDVLDRLPMDVISRTIWEDDDGTIVYHQWFLDAKAAALTEKGQE